MTEFLTGEPPRGLLYRGAEENRPVFTDVNKRKLVFVDFWPDGNIIRCLEGRARKAICLILHPNQIPISQLRKLKVWDLLPARTQVKLQTAFAFGKT